MTGEQSTNKRFVLTDESLNSSGFWIKTSGGDLSQFKKNPIMLWAHMRVWKGTEDEVLPIGNWKDTKIENGALTAEPFFDDGDPFAVKIKNKVEKGIIRMASVGIRVIETSADPKNLKPGQTRETITKWKLIEASICDIGRNENTLAFYDSDDNLITFSEENEAGCPVRLLATTTTQTNNENMKTVTTMLNLSESASEQEVFNAVRAIQEENQTLKAEKDARDQALKAEQKAEAESLLAEAFKDGRLNDDEKRSARTMWEKFFETNHEGAKQALSAIPKPKSVKEQLQTTEFKESDVWAKRQAEIEQNAKK